MLEIESTPDLEFKGFIRYPRITVEHGEFAFMVGESGCGKSSYLRLANGTVLPTAGRVLLKGKDASTIPPLLRRRRALLVPQETYLPDKTVRENFAFYFENRGDSSPSEADMRAALDCCCADEIALDSSCAELSGGERQRVFQAIFLSFPDWELLLLDEPTAALDKATEERFLANVRSLCAKRSATALVVSHSALAADAFATQVITLSSPKRGQGEANAPRESSAPDEEGER